MHYLAVMTILLLACAQPGGIPNQEQQGNRLRKQYDTYTGSDGTIAISPSLKFSDLELDIVCTPQKWSDGNTYCLPVIDMTTAQFFYDSRCSQPIYGLALPLGGDCASRAPDWVGVVVQNASCDSRTTILIRKPTRQTPRQVYAASVSTCQSLTPESVASYFLIDIGIDRPLPIGQFVKFQHQIGIDP